MSGTSTSFGAGFQDAFVVSVQPNGKAGSAATWGGTAFETGGGVGLTSDGTIVLGATTSAAPPYPLLSAPRKSSSPHGSFGIADGALSDATARPRTAGTSRPRWCGSVSESGRQRQTTSPSSIARPIRAPAPAPTIVPSVFDPPGAMMWPRTAPLMPPMIRPVVPSSRRQ
jgi:hypothetical protein